jgi:hypothetical protein
MRHSRCSDSPFLYMLPIKMPRKAIHFRSRSFTIWLYSAQSIPPDSGAQFRINLKPPVYPDCSRDWTGLTPNTDLKILLKQNRSEQPTFSPMVRTGRSVSRSCTFPRSGRNRPVRRNDCEDIGRFHPQLRRDCRLGEASVSAAPFSVRMD